MFWRVALISVTQGMLRETQTVRQSEEAQPLFPLPIFKEGGFEPGPSDPPII